MFIIMVNRWKKAASNTKSDVIQSRWGANGNTIVIHEPFEFVDEVHIIDSNIEDVSWIQGVTNLEVLDFDVPLELVWQFDGSNSVTL